MTKELTSLQLNQLLLEKWRKKMFTLVARMSLRMMMRATTVSSRSAADPPFHSLIQMLKEMQMDGI